MKFGTYLENKIQEKLVRQFLQSLPSTSENTGIASEATCGQSYFEYGGHRISDCEKQRTEAKLACSILTKRLLENLESSLSSDILRNAKTYSTVHASLSFIFHSLVSFDNSMTGQIFLVLLSTVFNYVTTLQLTDCKNYFLFFRYIVNQSINQSATLVQRTLNQVSEALFTMPLSKQICFKFRSKSDVC